MNTDTNARTIDDACHELEKGALPSRNRSTAWIKDIYTSANQVDRFRIRSSHVFWRKHRLRIGLRNLHQIAGNACKDLLGVEAQFQPIDLMCRFSLTTSKTAHYMHAAQKELMAFCAALTAFDDTLTDLIPEEPSGCLPRLKELRNRCFDSDHGVFLRLIRNSLLHTRNVHPIYSTAAHIPDWYGRTSTSVLQLSKSELQNAIALDLESANTGEERKGRRKKWRKAMAYFESKAQREDFGGHLPLPQAVMDHFVELTVSYQEILNLLAEHRSFEEEDFYALFPETLGRNYEDHGA